VEVSQRRKEMKREGEREREREREYMIQRKGESVRGKTEKTR
jgi:hypothetical protein